MADHICDNPECDNVVDAPKPHSRGVRYCSKTCQNRAAWLRRGPQVLKILRAESEAQRGVRACAVCARVFKPKTYKSTVCSKPCSRKMHRENSALLCVEPGCDRGTVARGWCGKHYNQLAPNAKSWKRNGDPTVRRAALRKKTQRRRALQRDPAAEVVDRDVVGERDGWQCGLCPDLVDRSLAWPHPQSASLDHVLPLSKGGKHRYSNTQIAHLSCNVAKGNRVTGEQLSA